MPYNTNSCKHSKKNLTSGVTMGWLLRLVTGGPHWQGGPRQFQVHNN